MKLVKYILVNESYSEDTVLAIRNSRVSDLRHDTSSVPLASPAPNLSMCSSSPVSNGHQPRSWESPSWDCRSVISESYLADAFAPVIP